MKTTTTDRAILRATRSDNRKGYGWGHMSSSAAFIDAVFRLETKGLIEYRTGRQTGWWVTK